jgi:hypothetical protein
MSPWSRGSLLLIGLAFLAPRLTHAKEAAEVTCKDGTTSKGGKGACSGHGGVDKSAAKATSESSKSKSPSASAASAGAPTEEHAEVTCKDGTTSKGGKGACSGHGGVDKSASASGTGGSAPPAEAPARAAAPAAAATAPATTTPTSHAAAPGQKGAPTAKCKDGSLSYAQHHSGACSDHGGVAQWLDATQK